MRLTHAKLLGVGLRILRDRALAEDVLQESYLKVWRHAASYDPSIASPMTWMATIVRHGAIDALRKRQIEAFAGDDDALAAVASNDPDPVEEMHLARLRPKALAAFAALPEDKRRLIMLAYLRDRSRHDLSVRLGIPANTIKTPPAARANGVARHDVCFGRSGDRQGGLISLRDDRRLGAGPGTHRQQQVMHTIAFRPGEAAGADIHLD